MATTEAKASRLLTPIVALLTGTVALVAFELHAAVTRDGAGKVLPLIGSTFGAIAALLLIIAAVRAIDADTRVGIYRSAGPEDLLAGRRDALRAEANGTTLARWASSRKATRVMFARAAFSRAIAFLVIALILGAATVLTAPTDAGSNVKSCPSSRTADAHPRSGPGDC